MKVYVLGDSISIQYGPYLQAYLDGVTEYTRKEGEDEASLDLDNPQGANGGDSSMVLAFLTETARGEGIDADLLLLNCGLHDIKTDPATGAKQVPIDQYEDYLRTIVQTVSQMRPKLVWIRSTPCDEVVHNRGDIAFHRFAADGQAYNDVADRVMAEVGAPIIDLYTFTCNLGEDPYCDHVHFHEAVRQQQGAFIAGWLAAFKDAAEGQGGTVGHSW